MLIASLVIVVTASIGSDPNFYQAESWKGPTNDELVTCATMARELNDTYDAMIRQGLNHDWQVKTATCELVAVGDEEEGAAPASDKASAMQVSYQF